MLSYRKEKHQTQTSKSTQIPVQNVINEYCLKRSQFNPKKTSPNRFCNKLEFRMMSYYNTLYTLSSSPPK